MGFSFSNIQLRVSAPPETLDMSKIASIMTQGQELTLTERAEEADVEILIAISKSSPWITITSDLIDGDLALQLLRAKELSDMMRTEALSIACFDSDYLCLNMIDFRKKTDIWAASGRFPYGKAPRRSNFSAWAQYVSDLEQFKQVMRSNHVFAEDCLTELETLMALPLSQSQCTVSNFPDNARIYCFHYMFSANQESRMPKFTYYAPPVYYCKDDIPQLVSFINHGDASKGVAVFMTGRCITEHQILVKSVELQHQIAHGEYQLIPVIMEKKEFSNGVSGLYGECPDLRIPPAVPEGLPWRKKMDVEFQRLITVRFVLTAKTDCAGDDFGPLQISLIPLKNFEGQSGWVMKYQCFAQQF